MLATIKKNSKNYTAVTLAQSMLLASGYQVTVDGDFGNKTESFAQLFQAENSLVIDGIIGEKTWQVLFAKSQQYLTTVAKRFLSEQDLIDAATRLGIQIAAIKAVNEVESNGSGFRGDFPAILFERHIFWKQLRKHGVNPHNFTSGNQDILKNKMNGRAEYNGNQRRRLERAMAIHPQAALESASWGAFQIMGFHWKDLGYGSVENFVDQMKLNEVAQLEGFTRYIVHFKCIESIKLKGGKSTLDLDNFRGFARCYNGPKYEEFRYHTKMLKAYNRYKAQEALVIDDRDIA